MESITIGQVLLGLVFILSLINNIKSIYKEIQNPIDKKIEKAIKPLKKEISNLELSSIKTDLVNFMSMAESNTITNEQKLNAYELYDRYCRLGGNSYIHDKWENLRKERKI